MKRKYHILREFLTEEVYEVDASSIDDAIDLLNLQEARLLSSIERNFLITSCWERPTGIA